ncbi:MAG: hypothetical protein MJ118_06465 [Clostridia bacterium]|nr:hypothetical protein [Clostridia bacterium]
MKKEIALLLVFSLMVVMLGGCTQKKEQPQETVEEVSVSEHSEEQPAQQAQPEEKNEASQEQATSTEVTDADEKTPALPDPEKETANAEEQTVSEQSRPLIDAVSGLYRYSNGEAYICILDNHTYAKYDFDRNADGKVRFWSRLDDNSIALYDENGELSDTLHAEGTSNKVTVTNGSGMKLKPFDEVMNGTYDCCISSVSYSKQLLLVMQKLPFWVSDETVAALEVGSVLNNTDVPYFDITVESLEKKTDSIYVINEETELKRDDAAGAWRLFTDAAMLQRIGRCSVDEKTELQDLAHDGAHKTLEECLQYDGFAEATVTVENGHAVLIATKNRT